MSISASCLCMTISTTVLKTTSTFPVSVAEMK